VARLGRSLIPRCCMRGHTDAEHGHERHETQSVHHILSLAGSVD